MAGRRKLIAALLSMVLVAGACGSSGSTASSKNGTGTNAKSLLLSPKQHATLSMWLVADDPDLPGVKAQVAAFEKLHPNIKIDIKETATAGNDPGTLAAAAAHKLPDIMRAADVDTYYFASHGLLLNLSPYMKAYGYKQSQFVSAVMQLGQYDGQQYVVPREFDEAVVAYNPQVLKKFGISIPKEGLTWSTFQRDACAMNKKVGGTQYYGVGTNLTNTSYILYDPFVASTGGSVLNKAGTKATLSSPDSLKGLSELTNFSRNCTSWFDNLPKGNDPFLSGHAAFDVVVLPQVQSWENTNGKGWSALKFPVNVVNFPLLSPTPAIGAGMVGYTATVDTKYPQAAAAFEMFMLSKQGELDRAKVTGSVPIRTDLFDSPAWLHAIQPGYSFNAAAFASYTKDIVTPPAKLELGASGTPPTAIANAWTAIQLRKDTVKQAFATAQSSINSWLQTDQG
jgi:multiple sugar transport system substrate-binding protein